MKAIEDKINWSSDNWNKETPGFIKLIYRSLMFFTLVWVAAIEPRVQIPVNIAHSLDVGAVMLNYAIYYFCQCFGFKQPENPPGTNELPKN